MLSPSKTTTASFEPKIRSTRIKKKWKIVVSILEFNFFYQNLKATK